MAQKEDPIDDGEWDDDDRLDQIGDICDEATEGPWVLFFYEKDGVSKADVLAAGRPGTILKEGSVEDARFVAVSRSAVPWLLDKYDRSQFALIRMCLEKHDGDAEKAQVEFRAMLNWADDPESVDPEKLEWVSDCLGKWES